MAKAMKMQDKKNYNDRKGKSFFGNCSGADTTEHSKYLAIKYDMQHGIQPNSSKKKFMEEYEKNNMIDKL
jgi:hypothetical protein